MIYIVEKGHPMNGRCTVNAYDREGGELQAQYSGWYRPAERRWVLYPLRKNSWENIEKMILPESAVKMGKAKKPPHRAQPRKPKQTDAPGMAQVKMI